MSAILAAITVLLAWHGGLHAAQAFVAALLLAVALWMRPPHLGLVEASFGAVLALLLLFGLPRALDPQAHLNALLWLVGGLAFFGLARRDPAWTALRAAKLWMGTGVLLSGAFVAAGFALASRFSGSDLSGPVVMPHLSARWFSPNQNLLAGAWAVPALLLCAEGWLRGRRWMALGLALCAAALVYAGSRGAYLSLAAGFAWWVLRQPQRFRAAVVAGGCAVAVAGLAWKAPFSRLAHRVEEQGSAAAKDENFYRRADFWRGALRLSRQAPLTGQGLGSFRLAAQQLDLPTPLSERSPIARYRLSLDHAHNDWLELAVEAGWPAAILLGLAALAWLAWRWRRPAAPWEAALEAGVVAALALSLFDMDLRTPGVLAGLLLSAGAMEKASAKDAPRWAWRLLAVVLLLSAAGLWCARSQRKHDDAFSASLGAWLQPLDADLQAQRVGRGEEAWPWAAWAGRRQSVWLSAQAHAAGELRGDAVAALAAEQRAALARPYWAPGWFKLAERQSVAGRPEAEVGESIGRALALEPNFARALAWRCDQAAAQGRVKEAQAIYRLIQHIQTLRYSQEVPDAYSLFIQSIPPEWLASRNKSLHLSTTFRPKS